MFALSPQRGKSRILIGTVEAAGTGRKLAFPNVEELREIVGRRKSRKHCALPGPRRRLRKEVMSAPTAPGLEESAEGVRRIKAVAGESFSLVNEKGRKEGHRDEEIP